MGAPKLYVKSLNDREKVRQVLSRVKPSGVTVHVSGKYPVWLFKPTEKGGTTIARVIDQSNDGGDVGEMIREVLDEVRSGT